MSTKKKTVSLVLGSGGARGWAHIGVIRWLEENGFKIEAISGSSAGALVGGIYAAGKLDEFEQWVCAITKLDIVTLLDFSWLKSGLIKGDKVINTLIELVGDQRIDDLPLAYTAVASDIVAEKEVWIRSGRLFDAIRASMSLPLFFTPFRFKGVDLIDGGVLNPVPIAPTFNDHTDITIAVNLGGPVEARADATVAVEEASGETSMLRERINRFLMHFKRAEREEEGQDWDVYDIASQAFDAMQSTIARQKLAAYPPEIVIDIPRNACGTLEFDRARELIDLGRERAERAMAQVLGREGAHGR